MKTKFYFLATLLIAAMCFNTMAQKNLLMISEVEPPAGGDSLLLDSLTNNWGYTVMTVDPDGFGLILDFSAYDAFIINESIGSSAVNGWATVGFPLPTLTFEAYSVRSDKWGWIDQSDPLLWQSGNSGTDVTTTVITDNTHYITQEYNIGDEIIWSTITDPSSPTYCNFDISAAVPDAKPLGKSKDPVFGAGGLHTFWALEEGTMVPGQEGGPALPVKRTVFYNTHENVLVPGTETAGLYNIIKRSLTWVLGDDDAGVAVHSIESGFSGVKLLTNPVRENGQISFNLKESGVVSFSVVNLIGQQTLLRTNESFSAGQNEISFSTSELNAGIYVYQLKMNKSIYSGKMHVLK